MCSVISLRTWSSIDEAPRFEGSSRETQVVRRVRVTWGALGLARERKERWGGGGVGKLTNCKTGEELQRDQREAKRSISMGLHKHRAALSVFSCVVVMVLDANQTVEHGIERSEVGRDRNRVMLRILAMQ